MTIRPNAHPDNGLKKNEDNLLSVGKMFVPLHSIELKHY